MKVIDLFCGCGGMGLGFQQAGFDIVYACDIDKYAIQSYRHNIGEHGVVADITKLTAAELPKADVWTFGFPCQDLSVAGKQAGMEVGTRSGLFYEVMRILDESENKPMVLMAENVKGLKPYLKNLEQEYAKRGYTMHLQLYNSKYWGVPQSRERYYVVGIRNDLAVHEAFEMPIEDKTNVPKLSTILEDRVDRKYFISEEKSQKILEQAKTKVEMKHTHAALTVNRAEKRQNGPRARNEEEPMFTITAQDLHGVILQQEPSQYVADNSQYYREKDEEKRSVLIYEKMAPTLIARDYKDPRMGIVLRNQATELVKFTDEANCLLARDYKGFGNQDMTAVIDVIGRLDMKGNDQIRRVYSIDGLAPTLTTAQGGYQQAKIFDPSHYVVRKLTPREYARLQGFPDSYEIVVSDTQAYKQFGNSVTVPLVKAIAESIKAVLLDEQSTS